MKTAQEATALTFGTIQREPVVLWAYRKDGYRAPVLAVTYNRRLQMHTNAYDFYPAYPGFFGVSYVLAEEHHETAKGNEEFEVNGGTWCLGIETAGDETDWVKAARAIEQEIFNDDPIEILNCGKSPQPDCEFGCDACAEHAAIENQEAQEAEQSL